MFPNTSDTTLSYNYTLQLQGLWTTAACSYVDKSQSTIAVWPDQDGRLAYGMDCSGDWLPQTIPLRNTTETKGLILTSACIGQASNNLTVHLRSFVDAEDYNSQIVPYPEETANKSQSMALGIREDKPASNGSVSGHSPRSLHIHQDSRGATWGYAGIEAMKCTLMPRVGRVVATYHTDIAAFSITPNGSHYVPFSQMRPMAQVRAYDAIFQTMTAFIEGQTVVSGNSFRSLIRSIGISHAGLDGGTKNNEYTLLVADLLKGIFEYENTHERLVLTAATPEPPCRLPVTGRLVRRDIGWHTQITTIIALIPLVIISLASLVMVLWAMKSEGKLTVFDPTSAVSLVAVTSAGEPGLFENRPELERDRWVTGDPGDEIVRGTKICYGYHEGKWDFKSY